MNAKHSKASAERLAKDIRQATRKQYSAKEKIRIVLEGLRGEDSIAEPCRREGPELSGRTLICCYNDATDTPNTDTGGYHHTITLASMRAAQHIVDANPCEVPLHVVLSRLTTSMFGKSDWLLSHWSREVLFSVSARRDWVDPDLTPLPF